MSKPSRKKKQSTPDSGHLSAIATRHQQLNYSGPFPPPQLLAQFEQNLPGSAERIFAHSEREQAHRHKIEAVEVTTRAYTAKINAWTDAIARGFGVLFLGASFGIAIYFSFIERDLRFATLFFSPSVVFALIKLISGIKAKKTST